VLTLQVKELTESSARKSRELEELLKRYQALEEKFYEIAGQEANKRELDIKLPPTLPSILASKNIFDIYLKTKVIDFCDV
jgi:hypothetical protein